MIQSWYHSEIRSTVGQLKQKKKLYEEAEETIERRWI